MARNASKADRIRVLEHDHRERKPSFAPVPAAPTPEPQRAPKLISCPNQWCRQSLYAEFRDDLGRVEGYCTGCGYHRERDPLGG